MIQDKAIVDSLELLGLSSKEIRFYLSALELGPTSIDQIVRHARLKRATGFLLVKNLVDRGFVEEDLKTYRKQIFAVSPKEILRLIAGRQRQFRRQEIEMEERLPELESAFGLSKIRPQVRVFSGRSGLISIWKDILSTKREILLWTNQAQESKIFTDVDHKKFVEERVKKNIPIRVLAIDNKEGRLLINDTDKSLRHVKFLPPKMTFSPETYLYDNKVAYLDYYHDLIGAIIESESIAESQRAIFELTWNNIR